MKLLLQQNSMQLAGEPPTDTNFTPRGVLPYKGLMGTYGQPGYVFRNFCLKQGQGMRGQPHPPTQGYIEYPPPPPRASLRVVKV